MPGPRGGSVRDPGLGLDAQTVSDPVRVGVVADDLDYVEDVTVGEPGRPQGLDISFVHRTGLSRQFDGEPQHRPPLGGQVRGGPVSFDRLDKLIIFDQPAQTAPVVDNSVVAVVLEAHH